MAQTYGSVEYLVVTGTVGAIGTFNAAVETQVNNGYAILDNGPQTDGTNIWQVMMKGSAASFTAEYPITAVVIGPPSTLTVAGDQTQNFNPGYKFTVVNSTGNNGVWTVVSSVYGANTVITLKETLPNATVNGSIIAFSPSVGP